MTNFFDIGTNVNARLVNGSNKDWTINVTSRELIRKNAPSPGGNVFQQTGTILALSPDIIRTNFLTKFVENWTKNVTSRVLQKIYCCYIRQHITPLAANFTINYNNFFKTQVLTKFHKDWTINVTSRETNASPPGGHVLKNALIPGFTKAKNAPTPGSHVYQPTETIFKPVQDIISY
ncbi:hypothetical protein DPMN_188291 [Dreissena polymorpha]|uniref:Uncharacterized protein n=1 Tax=Dreissena polymorpha TaxID=45954 RepID=A0A9D4DTK0_DREPO|nr:hypothetical protein DPMN_188291 [Dreissena polymorpha]